VARASGKIILLGEHAVVYGVPAIAAGIELGASAFAVPAPTASIRVGEVCASVSDDSELGRALAAIVKELGSKPCRVEAALELPPGAGLGASAALGVAVARALLEAAGEPDETERVLAAAAAWEHVFHGNASGVDAAASVYAGAIWFEKGKAIERLQVERELVVAIALAAPPASTKAMVEQVARQRERRPEVVNKALEGLRALVMNAKLCLAAGDLPGLGQLMTYAQMLLSGLFVSTEAIERCCALARDAGALGAKLTGAGGGGAVIALADLDAAPILAAWRAAGIECFATRVRARARGAEK
jgi:mevalonate kinase